MDDPLLYINCPSEEAKLAGSKRNASTFPNLYDSQAWHQVVGHRG